MRNALLEYGPLSQGRGPLYPRRVSPAVRIARPRQQQEQEQQQPLQQPVQAVAPPVAEQPAPAEQDDTGLVGKIADGGLTALGALSNLIDLPASSARDILMGKNPLDQWLDPLSHREKGTSTAGGGRDVLETYGMRKNKETGWVPLEDPGEFARDAAGFVAELALDPLAWASGGMSAAGKAGITSTTKGLAKVAGKEVAKEAGEAVAKEAGEAAAKAATKSDGFIRRAGKRAMAAADKYDPGQAIGRQIYKGSQKKSVQEAIQGAKARGAAAADGIKSVVPQQVQDFAGGAARRAGDITRKGGAKARETFDYTVMGRKTGVMQDAASEKTAEFITGGREFRKRFVPWVNDTRRYINSIDFANDAERKLKIDEVQDAMGDFWEFADRDPAAASESLRKVITDDGSREAIERSLADVRNFVNETHQALAADGLIDLNYLEDEFVDHMGRKLRESLSGWEKAKASSRSTAKGVDPQTFRRSRVSLFRQMKTSAANKMAKDTVLDEMLDKAYALEQSDQIDAFNAQMKKAADHISDNYDSDMLRYVQSDKDGKAVFVDAMTGDEVTLAWTKAKDSDFLTDAPVNIFNEGDTFLWNGADKAKVLSRKGSIENGFTYEVELLADGKRIEVTPDRVNRMEGGQKQTRTYFTEEVVKDADGNPVFQKDKDGNDIIDEATGKPKPEVNRVQHFVNEKHLEKTRPEQLAEHFKDHAGYHAAEGVFEPTLQSIKSYEQSLRTTKRIKDMLVDVFTNNPDQFRQAGRKKTIERATSAKLQTLFEKGQGLEKYNREKFYEKLMQNEQWQAKFAKDNPGATASKKRVRKYFDNLTMDTELYKDIAGVADFSNTRSAPWKTFNSFTSLFKAGVLTHPARYFRDALSGQIANMTHGVWDHESMTDSFQVMFGENVSDALRNVPEVQEYMKQRGWSEDAQVADAVAELFAASKGNAASIYREMNNLDDTLSYASFDDLASGSPRLGSSLWNELRKTWMADGSTWKPWDIEGVFGATETKFKPVSVGNQVGKMSDDLNRLEAFIYELKAGRSSSDAMNTANKVQLNYDPSTFTATERTFKKFVPFYSFFTRQSAYLAEELATNPSGRLGKLIRLQAAGARRVEDEDGNYIPEHARTGLSVPMGKSADGGTTYLSGLGLMHDDPIEKLMTLAIDTPAGVRKGLSMLNPLIKGPAEYAFGRSTFQGGPLGGRDLSDMDPTIGRILTNAGLQDPTPSGRAAPVMGQRWIENIAANSPVARILSNIKTLGDDRKSAAQRLMNLTTGMRFTTVSPYQSRAALRDLSDSILKEAGARKFSTYTPPTDEALAEIEKTNPEAATKLRAIRRNRELVNQERRAGIRRNEMQAVQQAIDSGQMPAMTKTQQQRYDRWVKNFGTETSPSQWTQYVYQRKADGTAQRSGIKDWAPKK